MSGSTYTKVETPTTDTSLNHFGYDFYVADIMMNIVHIFWVFFPQLVTDVPIC